MSKRKKTYTKSELADLAARKASGEKLTEDELGAVAPFEDTLNEFATASTGGETASTGGETASTGGETTVERERSSTQGRSPRTGPVDETYDELMERAKGPRFGATPNRGSNFSQAENEQVKTSGVGAKFDGLRTPAEVMQRVERGRAKLGEKPIEQINLEIAQSQSRDTPLPDPNRIDPSRAGKVEDRAGNVLGRAVKDAKGNVVGTSTTEAGRAATEGISRADRKLNRMLGDAKAAGAASRVALEGRLAKAEEARENARLNSGVLSGKELIAKRKAEKEGRALDMASDKVNGGAAVKDSAGNILGYSKELAEKKAANAAELAEGTAAIDKRQAEGAKYGGEIAEQQAADKAHAESGLGKFQAGVDKNIMNPLLRGMDRIPAGDGKSLLRRGMEVTKQSAYNSLQDKKRGGGGSNPLSGGIPVRQLLGGPAEGNDPRGAYTDEDYAKTQESIAHKPGDTSQMPKYHLPGLGKPEDVGAYVGNVARKAGDAIVSGVDSANRGFNKLTGGGNFPGIPVVDEDGNPPATPGGTNESIALPSAPAGSGAPGAPPPEQSAKIKKAGDLISEKARKDALKKKKAAAENELAVAP